MSSDPRNSAALTRHEQEILAEVLRAIRSLRFGHVQLIVQDARVIQIETLEKKRVGQANA